MLPPVGTQIIPQQSESLYNLDLRIWLIKNELG